MCLVVFLLLVLSGSRFLTLTDTFKTIELGENNTAKRQIGFFNISVILSSQLSPFITDVCPDTTLMGLKIATQNSQYFESFLALAKGENLSDFELLS